MFVLIKYKKYNLSTTATVFSFLSYASRLGATLMIFFALICSIADDSVKVDDVFVILCTSLFYYALAYGLRLLAEKINFSAWKKVFKKSGDEEKTRKGDLTAAIEVINAKPDKIILNYLTSLNPKIIKIINNQQAQQGTKQPVSEGKKWGYALIALQAVMLIFSLILTGNPNPALSGIWEDIWFFPLGIGEVLINNS